MDKYTELKEKLFFTLLIIDRAINRITIRYISNINNIDKEFCDGLLSLLKEERRNLLIEYVAMVGNETEFMREYIEYINEKEGRA